MDRLGQIIDAGRRIVFFGGAGVSTESGIPDFRSGGGLYSKASGSSYTPEQILSHDFLVGHPEEFFDYYRSHLLYPEAAPNAAHRALAALERQGKVTAVITQNIDGLHQAAGSRMVHELHGSVHRNTCRACGRTHGLEVILHSSGIPRCPSCGGPVRPDVVLYGESLDDAVVSAAVEALAGADTLVVGGTSLVVYPAAGLLHYFGGDQLVLINRQPTGYESQATLVLHEPIAHVLAPWAD